MVTEHHYRWDFIGLKDDVKPTPATSPKVTDGSTYYTSDDSKVYVWYKDQWYEKTDPNAPTPYTLPIATSDALGGIKVGTGLSIDSETGVLSANGGGGGEGIKTLTEADYNYPENNPTTIAMWLIDPGVYKIKYTNNTMPSIKFTSNGSDITFGDGEICIVFGDGQYNKSNRAVARVSDYSVNDFYFILSRLKGDGTGINNFMSLFDSNVTQTTGNSTTNVMSQDATTKLVFKDPNTRNFIKIGDEAYTGSLASKAIAIGNNVTADGASARAIAIGFGTSSLVGEAGFDGVAIGMDGARKLMAGSYGVAIGSASAGTSSVGIGHNAWGRGDYTISIGNNSEARAEKSIAIGNETKVNTNTYYGSIAIGGYTLASAEASVAIGGGNGSNYKATVTGKGAVAIGASSQATQQGEFNIGATRTDVGYNNTNFRLLTGVHDPVSANDAATKGYVDGLISAIESRLTAGGL